MLLQIIQSNDSLARSGNPQNNFLILAIVICILALMILLFIILRSRLIKRIKHSKFTNNWAKTTWVKQRVDTVSTVNKQSKAENNKEDTKDSKPDLKATINNILEQSSQKYIGYNPINIFDQSQPLNYPYVIMPKPACVIKFPQKGRTGKKGYKEEFFHGYLLAFFLSSFKIFDDRYVLIKGTKSPFEPDFSLLDEKEGINIFIDIEIDEPYEGINDIEKRKVTHYKYLDTNRNNALKNRGWITIRFAEIQIHQNPDGCCLFIADVIASINPKFTVPDKLTSAKEIFVVPQWTKEDAQQMSKDRYREKYLGINAFGTVSESSIQIVEETELGRETEEIVEDDIFIVTEEPQKIIKETSHNLLVNAINNGQYVTFLYLNTPTIVKPIRFNNDLVEAYCYVRNIEMSFDISEIQNIRTKHKPFTLEIKEIEIGIDRISSILATSIRYGKYVRMKYQNGSYQRLIVNSDNNFVLTTADGAINIRTISNIQLAINVLDRETIEFYNFNENFINAYCHLRNDKRTFKFDRIKEIAILDI